MAAAHIATTRRASYAGSEVTINSELSGSNLASLEIYHQGRDSMLGYESHSPLAIYGGGGHGVPGPEAGGGLSCPPATRLYSRASIGPGGLGVSGSGDMGGGFDGFNRNGGGDDNLSVMGEVDACSVRSERPLIRGRRASMSNAADMSRSDHTAIVKSFRKQQDTEHPHSHNKKKESTQHSKRGRRNSLFGNTFKKTNEFDAAAHALPDAEEPVKREKQARKISRRSNRRASVSGPMSLSEVPALTTPGAQATGETGETDNEEATVEGGEKQRSRRVIPRRSRSSDNMDELVSGTARGEKKRNTRRRGRRASMSSMPMRRRQSNDGAILPKYGYANHRYGKDGEDDRYGADDSDSCLQSSGMISYLTDADESFTESSFAQDSFSGPQSFEFLTSVHQTRLSAKVTTEGGDPSDVSQQLEPSAGAMNIQPMVLPLEDNSETTDVSNTTTSAGTDVSIMSNASPPQRDRAPRLAESSMHSLNKKRSYIPVNYTSQKGLLGGDETDTEKEEELFSASSATSRPSLSHKSSDHSNQRTELQQRVSAGSSSTGPSFDEQDHHHDGPKEEVIIDVSPPLIGRTISNHVHDRRTPARTQSRASSRESESDEPVNGPPAFYRYVSNHSSRISKGPQRATFHRNISNNSSNEAENIPKHQQIMEEPPLNGAPAFYTMMNSSKKSASDSDLVHLVTDAEPPLNGAPAFYTQQNQQQYDDNDEQEKDDKYDMDMPANGAPPFYASQSVIKAKGDWGCGLSEEMSDLGTKGRASNQNLLRPAVPDARSQPVNIEEELHFSDDEEEIHPDHIYGDANCYIDEHGCEYEDYDESARRFSSMEFINMEALANEKKAEHKDSSTGTRERAGGRAGGAGTTGATGTGAVVLPNFIPANGCTNASDYMVRCFVARMRTGITVTKHSRARWVNSHDRVLHILPDSFHLTWVPTEEDNARGSGGAGGSGGGGGGGGGETNESANRRPSGIFGLGGNPFGGMNDNANTNRRPSGIFGFGGRLGESLSAPSPASSFNSKVGKNGKTKEPTKMDLRKCVEVRHAWSRDPRHPKFTGTPTLRQKCKDGTAKQSFALIFPDRTVDFTAQSNDQCKILIEGFSALCFRLQMEDLETKSNNDTKSETNTARTGRSESRLLGRGGFSGKDLSDRSSHLELDSQTGSLTGTNLSIPLWGL